MNSYVVKLEIRIGDYEKHTHHIVHADDEEEAGLQAMRDEAHNELILKDDGEYWDNDMVYRVSRISLIDSVILLDTLQKFI